MKYIYLLLTLIINISLSTMDKQSIDLAQKIKLPCAEILQARFKQSTIENWSFIQDHIIPAFADTKLYRSEIENIVDVKVRMYISDNTLLNGRPNLEALIAEKKDGIILILLMDHPENKQKKNILQCCLIQ